MYIDNRLNRKTGYIYVYIVDQYWDNKEKCHKKNSTLIGKMDLVHNIIVPNRKYKERTVNDFYNDLNNYYNTILIPKINSLEKQLEYLNKLKELKEPKEPDVENLADLLIYIKAKQKEKILKKRLQKENEEKTLILNSLALKQLEESK